MAIFKRKIKKVKKASENWEFYFTRVNDRATSIRLDMDMKECSKFEELKNTYVLSVAYDEQYENGFPTKESSSMLHTIEDTIEFNWGAYNLYLAGISTTDGKRNFIFMSEDEVSWESICKKLMRRRKNVKYTLKIIHNDKGSYYLNVLYPDLFGMNWIENRKICHALEEQGELFNTIRGIDFYSYFTIEGNANEFIQEVKDGLIEFNEIEVSQNEKQQYQVYLLKKDIPNFDNINAITHYILTLSIKHDGYFDGWGTTIVKE